MPLEREEGPLGLVVCPSRELARQTHAIVQTHLEALRNDGWPELRCLLCVGGEDLKGATEALRHGVHMAVCTPGRLKDFLAKRRMNLDICRYLCLDEADRMVRLLMAAFEVASATPGTYSFTCALLEHDGGGNKCGWLLYLYWAWFDIFGRSDSKNPSCC